MSVLQLGVVNSSLVVRETPTRYGAIAPNRMLCKVIPLGVFTKEAPSVIFLWILLSAPIGTSFFFLQPNEHLLGQPKTQTGPKYDLANTSRNNQPECLLGIIPIIPDQHNDLQLVPIVG